MAKWTKIDDKEIRHVWKCTDEDCPEGNPESIISPEWYETNGTPVCECGLDMEYQRTEVKA